MKIGLHCNRFTWPGGPSQMGATLAAIGQRCEAAGFYSIDVMDHLFQMQGVGPAEMDMNEAYTTLGYLAGVTERIKLGVVVTGVTYRHPGLLIKQVTTLDVLSGGRAWLGLGAAWFEREHVGLGIPFPPLAERFERLEECLQIARQMWSGQTGRFEGRHYDLAETLCSPLPLQRPHPPIMIGGGGERKTLRLVAKYADSCNFSSNDMAELRRKLDVLRAHCEREGRDYDAIEKTTNTNLSATDPPAETIARLKALRDIGFTWAIGRVPNAHEAGSIELIGREIVPAVAEL